MPDEPVPDGLEDLDAASSVRCPICEQSFEDEEILAEHTKEEHG